MESLTLDDWRPASFLVVARLDATVKDLEDRSFTVEFDEVHGEHAAVVRLPAGPAFYLVATPGTPLGGVRYVMRRSGGHGLGRGVGRLLVADAVRLVRRYLGPRRRVGRDLACSLHDPSVHRAHQRMPSSVSSWRRSSLSLSARRRALSRNRPSFTVVCVPFGSVITSTCLRGTDCRPSSARQALGDGDSPTVRCDPRPDDRLYPGQAGQRWLAEYPDVPPLSDGRPAASRMRTRSCRARLSV